MQKDTRKTKQSKTLSKIKHLQTNNPADKAVGGVVREDNGYIDKTVIYSYDNCGDILSKTEYALTSSETLGTPVDTINYAYTDSNFKNGVTLYDGTDSIVYDANGNPTSYRGYSIRVKV